MKKLILLFIVTLFSCSSDENENNTPTPVVTIPVLTTSVISNITLNGASSGGNITSNGGADITARGVVWSTSPNPTISLTTKTTDGVGVGTFTSNLISLIPNTTYYVRAYATNSAGTAYGNEVSFITVSIQLPVLTTTAISNITLSTASSGGIITSDGGGTITARGVVWSTSQNPTIALTTKTIDGSGSGIFNSSITSLAANTQYYVRAYATNSAGTAYGNQENFTSPTATASLYPSNTVFCNGTVTAIVDVTNPNTGKTWMDRNLGASQVATSSSDAAAYGDLYQWGRRADGHQCRNSQTTNVLSSTNVPSHGNFIINPSIPYNWREPQSLDLWQGVNGINNPCPNNYRLPTYSEWVTERTSWFPNNEFGAFTSIKLPLTGNRNPSSGNVGAVFYGHYWSSTVSATDSANLTFCSGCPSNIGPAARAFGYAVRCIKN
jgi:uncharacterized protein (TIGR02145 family)